MPSALPVPSPFVSGSSAFFTEDFFALVHRHQQSAFQIAHGILRDESAAETITSQVFTRVRRRLLQGMDTAAATLWIYRACLRFCCRYYWKSTTPAMRRRLSKESCRGALREFALDDFVRLLARQPARIDARDCELVALRHVLGLSLSQIGQLMRMHPYEISNRLSWSRERMKETDASSSFDHAFTGRLLHPLSA